MRSEMTCPIESESLPAIDRAIASDRAAPGPVAAPLADVAPTAAPSLSRVLAAHGAAAGALDALVHALPIGVAMTDRTGHVVYANPAARAFPLVELPALQRAVAQAVSSGLPRREERVEWRVPGTPRQGGARHWLDVAITPVAGGDREVVGALLTIADVTTRIQATEWRPLVDSLARL